MYSMCMVGCGEEGQEDRESETGWVSLPWDHNPSRNQESEAWSISPVRCPFTGMPLNRLYRLFSSCVCHSWPLVALLFRLSLVLTCAVETPLISLLSEDPGAHIYQFLNDSVTLRFSCCFWTHLCTLVMLILWCFCLGKLILEWLVLDS